MVRGTKANRTRQVQFRMDPDLAKRLHAAIIFDDSMHSMADLFNQAAEAYLKNPDAYHAWINAQGKEEQPK